KAVIIDIESYQKTLNAISLAKLLSFGEKDIKNGNVVSHENAKKIFEKTLSRKNNKGNRIIGTGENKDKTNAGVKRHWDS
ncbi:MAG: hypothetical protein LBQ89_06000, partial [Treponema sp.]|nr:hypothetical protein [Treponema sp.]